ncbi:hypothetical protein OC845_004552 [Tilletia horrida]|nr:hypothetical protein OC845_004552 [Tilletia horrida]
MVRTIIGRPELDEGVVVNRIEVPSRDIEVGTERYILVDVYEFEPTKRDTAPHVPAATSTELLKQDDYNDASKDGSPKIDTHALAASPDSLFPVPVHITMHGSGFITPNLGEDSEFASWLACQSAFAKQGGVVFDSDYRKAPEHPFPAGLEDVEDVIRYVWSKPDIYDRSRITIGGFSAGATLAIGAAYTVANGKAFVPNPDTNIKATPEEKELSEKAAAELAPNGIPRISIAAIACAYPATDLRPEGERESVREPLTKIDKSGGGGVLPKGFTQFLMKAYLTDLKFAYDKRASVTLIEQEELPRHIYIAAGEADSLFPEARQFIDKLNAQGHPDARLFDAGAEGHGFDIGPKKLLAKLHTDAFHLHVLDTILRGWADAPATKEQEKAAHPQA